MCDAKYDSKLLNDGTRTKDVLLRSRLMLEEANQGLPVSKACLLLIPWLTCPLGPCCFEMNDPLPITRPVAHLPFGPVQLPDANDYQKVLEDNIISCSVAGALKNVRVVTWEWSLV